MAERVRIGTRGSLLALRQAEQVAAALRAAWPDLATELVVIRTTGDHLAHAHLAAVGGKGLFVKEIEEALLDGRVELAVHSLKDLPATLPEGLRLAAFPAREDPRDVLVSRWGADVSGLPSGARVGTSSPRRRVQLLAARADLRVEPIRGNVDTRLRKLADGAYDAVVVAAAGLRRLGLEPAGARMLPPEVMLPAVGQGVLAIETRADDRQTASRVAAVNDPPTHAAAVCERAFLERVGGSCTTALAAYARPVAGGLRLDALVAAPDGTRCVRGGATGTPETLTEPEAAAALGRAVAERLLRAGAAAILATPAAP